jgi:hypothetical protein
MNAACEGYIRSWLAEIEGETFDPSRAAAAARQVADCLTISPSLRQLLQALAGDREDHLSCAECQALLPEYIHAQFNFDGAAQNELPNPAVTNHLALCPYCIAAYAGATEAVLAYTNFTLPTAEEYPAIALPPATQALSPARATGTQATTSLWAADVVQRALAEGKQWVRDTLDGLYLLFQPAAPTTVALGVKAATPGMLLAQSVAEDAGWEIEASAFVDAQSDALCRIEVALYQVGLADAELAGIPVTLQHGAVMQTASTDANGIVEFTEIALDELPQSVIRLSLPA